MPWRRETFVAEIQTRGAAMKVVVLVCMNLAAELR
jgi:hypothetical protein